MKKALTVLALFYAVSESGYAEHSITNGNDVEFGKYPWFAALNIKYNPLNSVNCGGTLIATEWVVTAAHCAVNYYPDIEGWQPRAVFGMYDKNQPITQSMIYYGVEVYLYPSWPNNNGADDIALIRLDRPVSDVIPIPLTYEKPTAKGVMGILGYGIYTVVNGVPQYPDKMQQASIPVQMGEICNNPEYAIQNFNETTEICAGTIDGIRINAGLSDSGSPSLITTAEGDYQLAGIVSRGSPYDNWIKASPGVYTYVAAYADWIYSHVKDN